MFPREIPLIMDLAQVGLKFYIHKEFGELHGEKRLHLSDICMSSDLKQQHHNLASEQLRLGNSSRTQSHSGVSKGDSSRGGNSCCASPAAPGGAEYLKVCVPRTWKCSYKQKFWGMNIVCNEVHELASVLISSS